MRQGTLIGPIIIAVGIVIAAISFALVGAVMDQAKGATELRVERMEEDLAEAREVLDTLTERTRQTEIDLKRALADVAPPGSMEVEKSTE